MRSRAAIVGTALLLICAQRSVRAQAFVDDPNSLSAGVAYTYAPSGTLLGTPDDPIGEVPNILIFGHLINIDASYATPINGLAVEGELPIVGVKVGEGSFEHFPVKGPYDDGDLHWIVTDPRIGLRYQLKPIEQYLGLAFAVAGSFPTGYDTIGLAAPGHGLKALHMSVAVARTFDPIIPKMFFQAEYEFALVERVHRDESTEKLNRNYSEGQVMLGYFLPANFTVDVAAQGRFTHGGITFDGIIFQPYAVQYYHDQLLDEDFIHVGGDVSYEVNDSLSFGLSARFFVWGSTTRNQNLFGVNANYQFF